MKLTTQLNVSADYLFQRLIDTVLYDISSQTNQHPSIDKLNGFKYESNYLGAENVETTVSKVKPGEGYQLEFSGPLGKVIRAVKLHSLGKNKVELSMLEKSLPKDKANVGTSPFAWLKSLIYRHNLKKMLKNFEIGY